ncbi:MAG: substrate-binding domain-containing protein [Thermacetogeniaceae bacterium]
MSKVKIFLVFVLACAIGIIMAGCASKPASTGTSSTSGGKNYVIGFSNSYNGNSLRQEEESAFKTAADQLIQEGQIGSYTIVESNNNSETQAAQIENLVLKHVSAIVLDPGSPTALNGAIAKAQAANIPVIVINDGPVTTTYSYQLINDSAAVSRDTTLWMIKQMGGKGNVLILRGIAGTSYDIDSYNATMDVINQYPGIKVVGTVYCNWTDSVAQTAVANILPSLPRVDGIVGQGGDEYGAAQAFIAAGRPIPVITGGNRGNYLNWWIQESAQNPKFVSFSECDDPSFGVAGLYLAVDILNGVKVPQNMIYPNLTITQADLPKYAAMHMSNSDVAMSSPTQQSIRQNIESEPPADLSKYLPTS